MGYNTAIEDNGFESRRLGWELLAASHILGLPVADKIVVLAEPSKPCKAKSKSKLKPKKRPKSRYGWTMVAK